MTRFAGMTNSVECPTDDEGEGTQLDAFPFVIGGAFGISKLQL